MSLNNNNSEVITTTPKTPTDNSARGDSIIDMDDTKFNTPKTAKQLVRELKIAFNTGKTRPLDYRRNQLKRLRQFLQDKRNDILDVLYEDMGKPRQEGQNGEIDIVSNDLHHTLANLERWANPEKPSKRLINWLDGLYIYKDPYGIVLIVGAWNYPILLSIGPLIGAIAAGNCILLKTPELAQNTSKFLASMLPKYLDPETFKVYQGGVNEFNELLEERFDYIFFTGSPYIGRLVYQAAARHLTPTTLELGGKCPAYLDNTCNMSVAAQRLLWGRCINSGQTCVAVDYLLCTKEVQESFLQEASKALKKFYGEDPINSPDLSRIINQRHFNRLLKFIEQGEVALGGKYDETKRIITPTVLINCTLEDAVMKEEIFGPILPIITVKSPQEAIGIINEREKPLALYVFTNNSSVKDLFLKKTSSGGVAINDTVVHLLTENLPFGGVGHSGIGSYHGKYGFDTFVHHKGVLIKRLSPVEEIIQNIRYPPYSERKTEISNLILKRRKGFPFWILPHLILFSLGIAFAYLIQYATK